MAPQNPEPGPKPAPHGQELPPYDLKIQEYTDYRLFLRDAFFRQKATLKQYSYVYVARRVGCSDSFLKKLHARKTHLGLKYASKLFAVLGLSEFEKRYLYFWILSEASADAELKGHLNEILLNLRGEA